MVRMSDVSSIGANGTNPNVISGKVHEFVTRPSIVRVAGSGSATGLNVTVLLGGRSICQDQVMSAANRFPVLPDDIITEGGARPGDRIAVSVRNTTSGARTSNIAVDVIPVR